MTNNMTQLEFQLYDWQEDHQINDDSESEEDIGEYIIHAFGRCYDGKSVYAKITGFTPYFYILLPNKLQNKSKQELETIVNRFSYVIKSNDNKKVYYKYKKSLIELQLVKFKKAEGFTNNKEFYFIRLIFNNSDGMKKYKSYFENNDITIPNVYELNKPIKYKLYEANLPPMFRCFHIRDISGCSWIQTNKYKLIDNDDKESLCNIEINVDYRDLVSIKKDENAPFRICSFDIECNSIDGEFPQAKRKGDAIIQIGCTYTYIGQSEPYRQYIVCLKETSKLDNIIVDSCETEEELLGKFLDEIQQNDCDIITGYNIFFFDEKYINDRCHLLGIADRMSYLSKLRTFKCKFNETKLASSAMGENLLRLWNTPGRVHIDLMKDIQKTFSLPCYKLDYIASKYIRDKVISYKILENSVELTCKGVQDILVHDYIHLELIKGFVSDEIGDKYMVLKINKDEKKLIIKSTNTLIEELNNLDSGEIYWSQAKDDVGPKDIFRLQKGNSDDRAIVAKYCVKDCKLVNLLINKLEVVTKNIEMANVCYVPLSYLFTRGQGIKLFSLCLREFRKQKYLFPVIKLNKLYKCTRCNYEYENLWTCPNCRSKDRLEIEGEDSSYEGAIVFDPVPKVEYEALVTKDYASLYPSSILHKNMSHETIVENPEYDNLPNVKYYNANFRESDGSIQYRRFAQIDNKFGVIPSILDNLMKERKSIKKQMKTVSDPFKSKILDAKQLAVKVTANSLYGQLGAPTSPVCKRDIAACTTSTGKEMLILAKKYDEELLPSIMNSLKYFSETNQKDKYEKLLDDELKARDDKELINNLDNYIKNDIKDLVFQPVIRYGDTDSIFSCYRFREDCKKVNNDTGLKLWKKIIKFAHDLLIPYFKDSEKEIFSTIFNEYYSQDKIINMELPEGPKCLQQPSYHKIILPLNERIKSFIKEYMEESYLPWLWTLSELVEKNYTFMFDIKLTKWAIHQLEKIKLIAEDLDEDRHNYLIKPILLYLEKLFENKYETKLISDKMIKDFANKFNKDSKDCFDFASEVRLNDDELFKLSKKLFDKTIKEKWVYSSEKKELMKLVNTYLKSVSSETSIINEKAIYYITNFINDNNNLSIDKIAELLNKNLISDQDMNIKFDKELLEKHTKIFIDKYNKTIGKKSLEEIIIDFISKDLLLSMTLYKDNHYNKVIQFVNNNMRQQDMSTMDEDKYIYYWVQPRWDYDGNRKKYIVDIYEGGKSIIDKRTLEYGMKMGELSGELIKSHLPFPHDCEYEKTFWPFAILTKKKYVGNKYEFDPNKYKQDFMGIVLKRRDNSPIVKEICGGIINQLIDYKNPEGAKEFTRKCLKDMFDGKYNIKYFLQSRSLKLKESYKDWKKISHVYLAEKIAQRDPGNAPQSGDRIEFAVIKVQTPTDGTKLLQGDMIETPQYIKENKLQVDYLFYLTNQIMNPALQFLELVDKDSIKIFNEFIEYYSNPKPKKNKIKIENKSKTIIEYKKLINEINAFIKLNSNKEDYLTKFIIKNNNLFTQISY